MSWQSVVLADISTIFNGKTPSKNEQRDIGHPVLKIKDVDGNGFFKGVFESFVEPEIAKKFLSKQIKLDDTLVLNAAHNSDYVGSKQYRAEPSVVGSLPTGEWLIARANAGQVHPRFLNYWLRSPQARFQIKQLVKGIHLYPKDVARLEILLPPMPEQKRIAAILDKADAIRRKRQQAIQLADDFLRAVFLDMFGDPVMNPKGWEVKGLSEVARIQIGPFGTQLHKEDYIEGGIPLINPTHIVEGKIVPDLCLTISEEKYRSLPEYHLKVDDIIMGRRGAMGRCAIVGDTEKNYICGTGSLIVQPFIKGAFSLYLYKLLSSAAIKEYLESESIGATLPNLNKGIVGGIQVPVPDKTALNKFEEILGGIHAVSLRNSLFNEQLFFDSLSQKAFSCGL